MSRTYTFSFFVKVPTPQTERWWHRLLRVTPRPVEAWQRRHFTTDFVSEAEAIAFSGILMRPPVLAGILLPRNGLANYITTTAMFQLEEHGGNTNYITTALNPLRAT